VRQPTERGSTWRKAQADGVQAGAGQPAPRRAGAKPAGLGVAGGTPAGGDAAQPVGPHIQERGEQVIGCAVHLPAQHQSGDVPRSDADGPGVRPAGRIGWCGRALGGGLMHGSPVCLAAVRPVCAAVRDGLLDGILDWQVTGVVRDGLPRSGLAGGSETGGFLVQSGSEAGQGAAAAAGGGLVFQAADGCQADPGLGGELFLGQQALAACLLQSPPIQDAGPALLPGSGCRGHPVPSAGPAWVSVASSSGKSGVTTVCGRARRWRDRAT